MTERASEIEWLRWFARTCDFGPAHSDVVYYMMEDFAKETGKRPPADWDTCNECGCCIADCESEGLCSGASI